MEVTHVVASIISAFGNGMDLFRRMAGKKPKRKGREPTVAEEEAWLRESLYQRPLDIQKSYRHHTSRHGPRYEIGDTIAHTSLAHTLLTLNSGLIKLINQALSRDSKKYDDTLTRRSLLSLSEMAAADTLNALSQLSLRLSSQSQLSMSPNPQPLVEKPERKEEAKELRLKGGKGIVPAKKRPGPAPLLVRGGWVRPKTSSVVSSASSKSGKGSSSKHQRSKSEPLLPKTSRKSPGSSPKTSPRPQPAVPVAEEVPIRHKRSTSDVNYTQRPPSMLLVPSDFFLAHQESQTFQQEAPPRPPKIPLHSRPNISLTHRPKSSGTMRSASTKIGEIPDRHSQMLNTVQEQVHDPRLVEYIMSTSPEPPPETKRRGRGFRFWKKEHNEPVAAY